MGQNFIVDLEVMDFIRGASRSKDGKPSSASTAKEANISYCSFFNRRRLRTTSRGDVHYVVTEYGVADLYG